MSNKKEIWSIGLTQNCKWTLKSSLGRSLIFDELSSSGGDFHFSSSIDALTILSDCIVGDRSIEEWIEIGAACGGVENGGGIEGTKVLEEIVMVVDPTDPKRNIPLYVFSNPNCITSDIQGNNIIDINNYDMSLVVGVRPELAASTTPSLPFEFCPEVEFTGTLQDLFNIAIQDTGFVLPDGTAPDGLLNLTVIGEYKGSPCAGGTTSAEGFTVGTGATLTSFGAGEGACYKAKYRDVDCDNKADQCIDLTKAITVNAGAGIKFDVVGVVCDEDVAA